MNGNLVWVGGQNETIKQQSGITSTENESVDVSSLDSQGHGVTEDKDNDACYVGITDDDILKLSGYTTTTNDSVNVNSLETDPAGLTTDENDNPIYCGWGSDDGARLAGYTTTQDDTIDLSSLSAFPQSIGFTGADVIATDGGNLVLTLYSGWTTTVSDSIDVSATAASSGRDISQDADNTLLASDGNDIFYEFDGICSTSTINNSLDRSSQDNNISGVDTDDATGRNFDIGTTVTPAVFSLASSVQAPTVTGVETKDVKVQRGVVNFGASADTDTSLSFDSVSALTAGFARLSNTLHTSGGRSAGSTTSYNNDDVGTRCELTAVGTVTLTRLSAGDNNDRRHAVQILEYVGEAGGDNEFIVRQIEEVTIANAASSNNSSDVAVTTVGDCVPFICGVTHPGAGRLWGHAAFTAEIVDAGSGNANILLTRGTTTSAAIVVVAMVEFTGSNWTVEETTHTFSSAGANEESTLTTATGAWNTKFIVPSHRLPEHGLDEIGYNVWPGSGTNKVYHRLRSGASTAGSHHCVSYVVQHSDLVVDHIDSIVDTETEHPTGSASPQTINVTVATQDATDTTYVIGTADCNGTGTAYPRPMWNYRLTSTTNVEWWRGRHGQASDWALQTIDLSGLVTVAGGGDVTVEPSVLSVASSVQAPTVSTEQSVTVTPSVLSIASSVQAPTVDAEVNVTVTPSVLSVASSVQAQP